MPFGHVRIDQEHRNVALGGHAEREIDARESLAVSRQRTGDHDDPRLAASRRLTHGFFNEWALDAAILIGKLPILLALGEVAAVAQRRIVHDDLFGKALRVFQGLRGNIERVHVHMWRAGDEVDIGAARRAGDDVDIGAALRLLAFEARDSLLDQAHVATIECMAEVLSRAPAQLSPSTQA